MSTGTFNITKAFEEKISARFASALASIKPDDGEFLIPYKSVRVEDILLFIESAFWASLTPEEGRYHPFRLILGPQAELNADNKLSNPVPCTPKEISNLAPVLTTRYSSLGVWHAPSGGLAIWGIIRYLYPGIEITAKSPGQLLFSMQIGDDSFEVVITGSRWDFIDKSKNPFLWAYYGGSPPSDLISRGLDQFRGSVRRSSSYESIARYMLGHHHGGTLVIVPEDVDAWNQSISSIRYECGDFTAIAHDVNAWDENLQMRNDAKKWFIQDAEGIRLQRASNEALEFVAQLTAVDGATILGRDLNIYGFGAKLKPLDSNNKPQYIYISKPFEGSSFEAINLSDLGGTRHQSAAQFVFDQRDCMVVVCSQDGRLSSLNWNSELESVQVITNLEYAL